MKTEEAFAWGVRCHWPNEPNLRVFASRDPREAAQAAQRHRGRMVHIVLLPLGEYRRLKRLEKP